MKLIDISMYLVYVAMFSIAIPIVVGLLGYKKLNTSLKIFFVGLVVVLFLDFIFLFIDLRNTISLFYIFSALDIIFLTWVFSKEIKSKSTARWFILIASLTILLLVIDAFFYSGLRSNGVSNAITKASISIIAIYFLSTLFREDILLDLTDNPMYWISIGAITYNLIGFFDIFNSVIMNFSQNLYLQYYMFWSFITIVVYLLYAHAFWKGTKRQEGL